MKVKKKYKNLGMPNYPFLTPFVEGESRAAMTVARFDPAGKHVFLGTSAAYVLVFNTRTKTVSAVVSRRPSYPYVFDR